MIDALIAQHLASIDDLAELKVTLVALHVMEQRNSASAHVTADELASHPALRDGLGAFPRLSLEMALRKATARGTLLAGSEDVATAQYFANTPAAKLLMTHMQVPQPGVADGVQANIEDVLQSLGRLIERLEGIDAYPASDDDRELVGEWLAQGYVQEELAAIARAAYRAMRKPGQAPRALRHMQPQLKTHPPKTPSRYYQAIVARTQPLDEASIAFREMSDRLPNGREHAALQHAVALHGISATVQTLASTGGDAYGALALLAERDAAVREDETKRAAQDQTLRTLTNEVMQTLGGTPTSTLADEIRSLHAQFPDAEVWQAALQKAAAENKRSWAYVRAIVSNPSPNLLVPAPVNAAAKHAFDLYRKRVGRGALDVSVARDMNTVAEKVADEAAWSSAFDAAAAQNALNWNYIKAVLLGSGRGQETGDGKRPQKATARRGAKAASQREQVSYSDEARQQAAAGADAELAALEERRKRRGSAR